MDCFDNCFENTFENNACNCNLVHNAEVLQEILNKM